VQRRLLGLPEQALVDHALVGGVLVDDVDPIRAIRQDILALRLSDDVKGGQPGGWGSCARLRLHRQPGQRGRTSRPPGRGCRPRRYRPRHPAGRRGRLNRSGWEVRLLPPTMRRAGRYAGRHVRRDLVGRRPLWHTLLGVEF
jgi:hypothetical protein